MGASCLGNPCEYSHKPYITESRLIELHFAAVSLCLSYSNLSGELRKMILFRRLGVLAVQGHPRSINLVPIESAGSTSY